MKIIYTIIEMNGDYAVAVSDKGNQTDIARALLPYYLDEGDKVVYEYGMYRDYTVDDEN